MNPQTPAQLRSRIKDGDWVKVPGKSVIFEVRIRETGIELQDDWTRTFPLYEWGSMQELGLITAEAMANAMTSSQQ
jgi:hypothetical protein